MTDSEHIFQPDGSWTLFLDRDGVINRRPVNDYVKKWEEFEFLPGVLDAFAVLSKLFRRIIVVTNQQGVGKGLMSVETLEEIHQRMRAEIEAAGGRVDAIYYCTELAEKPLNCRKPSTFMAQKAVAEFSGLDLQKSLMAGDSISDLQFGRNSGMKTVYIDTNRREMDRGLYDLRFDSLEEMASYLQTL